MKRTRGLRIVAARKCGHPGMCGARFFAPFGDSGGLRMTALTGGCA